MMKRIYQITINALFSGGLVGALLNQVNFQYDANIGQGAIVAIAIAAAAVMFWMVWENADE